MTARAPVQSVPAGGPRPADPVRPEPASGAVRRRFTRGKEHPQGVAWFGIRAFWGHLRHFVASAIATEDVDSRDWMTADEPRALSSRVARLLGAQRAAGTVTESLGRDLWIDYVADTGDDAAVSRAVAALIFAPYDLPDPDHPGAHVPAPRGDLLVFGGDTAYPVSTADEIRDRVLVPFNQVLETVSDGRRRVLLGIPGNHDWYDGLDGFGRLFRRHLDFDAEGHARPTLHGSSRRTMLGNAAAWAKEMVRGGHIDKPKALALIDYTAAQAASYFTLPVAPGITMLAVDRQLKKIDTRQRHYFGAYLNQNVGTAPWVLLPDPVYAFGEPSPTGTQMVRDLGLTLTARSHFILSGDIHHYRRETEGPTLHVTAGGGGAFLHPAAIAGGDRRSPTVEWPSVKQSHVLLRRVPWKIGIGRSGLLPHLAFLVVFAPPVLLAAGDAAGTLAYSAGFVLPVVAVIYSLIGGMRRRRADAVPLSLLIAGLTAAAPWAITSAFERLAAMLEVTIPGWALVSIALVASVLVATFLFGIFLALLTRFGYENTQAFTALDHPGFKHFVRLRVRADGSAVDGWVIGRVDPLCPGEPPVLVDQFTWRPR